MASSIKLTCGPVQLRLVGTRHAHQMFSLAREPEVSRYLQWRPHRSIADSLSYIHDANTLYKQRTAYLLGIFEGESGPLLGATGISNIDRANRRGEIGTWLGLAHQRRGVNRYAKAAIFQLGFELLQLERLELLVKLENTVSLRAMANLPGVVDEGVQRARIVSGNHVHDARMFAIVRRDYNPRDWPAVTVEGTLP